MRILVALAMISMALAGCLSGEPAQPDTPPTTDPAPLTGHPLWVAGLDGTMLQEEDFPLEAPSFDTVFVTSRRSGEPTIGITRSGAVFYPSIEFDSGVPGAATLPTTDYFRSVDGGEHWEVLNPHVMGYETHSSSFDPYVYVDPTTGRIYAMDMGPHVACNKVSWSDNDGYTWTTREGACPTPVADHPSIFAGPKVGDAGLLKPATDRVTSYPNNVYLCSNQIADVQCNVSPDGGATWLPSQPVFVGVDTEGLDDPFGFDWLCGSLTGHGHASFVDGTVYLGRGYCGAPMVAYSHDGGINWEVSVISGNASHYLRYEHDVSVATDRAGNAYALWNGNNDTQVFLSKSLDQGRTWSEPQAITAPGVTAVKLASLVAGEEGRLAFQYIGTTTPSGWNITNMADGNETEQAEYRNATWHAFAGMIVGAHTEEGIVATTTVNDMSQPLKRGACFDRCFGDMGGMYDFLDIDIDPMSGRIWTALVDVCSGECDMPDADADTFERAVGVVGRQVGGARLLDAPIPEA